MLEVQHLDWDTNFFGYEVGKIMLAEHTSINNLMVNHDHYELVYLFSEEALNSDDCKNIGADLVDIKIEFIKSPQAPKNILIHDNQIKIKKAGQLSDDLLQLVYESGIYSRFKLDNHFVNNEFEKLYKAWIEKSFSDEHAEVLGAYNNQELVGFVSLGLKFEIANIGLIAVKENARGMHIGKKLLEAANEYAIAHHSKYLTVVTQENNIQAMHFYQKNGFTIDKKTYIYHLWKNTQ